MKVAVAPLRVPRGRLRRETPGHDMRVHGVNIVDVENDAHPTRRRGLIIGLRDIQGSLPDPTRCEGAGLTPVGYREAECFIELPGAAQILLESLVELR